MFLNRLLKQHNNLLKNSSVAHELHPKYICLCVNHTLVISSILSRKLYIKGIRNTTTTTLISTPTKQFPYYNRDMISSSVVPFFLLHVPLIVQYSTASILIRGHLLQYKQHTTTFLYIPTEWNLIDVKQLQCHDCS